MSDKTLPDNVVLSQESPKARRYIARPVKPTEDDEAAILRIIRHAQESHPDVLHAYIQARFDTIRAEAEAKGRAEQREADAKICDERAIAVVNTSHFDGLGMGDQRVENAIKGCAAAIRAGGG